MVTAIKDNTRLRLELVEEGDGDKLKTKSKTYSRVKPGVKNEDLYKVAKSLVDLQIKPVHKIKRLEEIELVEE